MTDNARKSLDGVWVGDCVGNLGQLYFAHDILKALETGMAKFGGQLDQFHKQFQYSDDTEEAIVLYNHLRVAEKENRTEFIIDQDRFAKELAIRYWTRDPDGEIYGYGLNTRKVLKDIYDGVPWDEANKIVPKGEGMASQIDSLVDSLAKGKGFKEAVQASNDAVKKLNNSIKNRVKEGSCGNGSAMRVAPLGAFLADHYPTSELDTSFNLPMPINDKKIIMEGYFQSEVTHCHTEGIKGSVAITSLAYDVTLNAKQTSDYYFDNLLRRTVEGDVHDGIKRAKELGFDVPIGEAIKVLGNGTHVTCQDTVPLCCWLAIKALTRYSIAEMYEKSIIETSMCFGDVDTNCAIVGGVIGIASPPPVKWVQFCQPMEGVYGEEPMKPELGAMQNRFQKIAGI